MPQYTSQLVAEFYVLVTRWIIIIPITINLKKLDIVKISNFTLWRLPAHFLHSSAKSNS